jgi:hypothetical protein
VQFAAKLEAKWDMEEAEWDFWKEADKQQEVLDMQICGPLLFEWDDLSEESLWDADKHLRQSWNAYEEMAKEMVITSHLGKSNKARATNPSSPYHQIGSHAKESDKMKWRRKRKKTAETTTSQDMGSGEDFVKRSCRRANWYTKKQLSMSR